MALLKRLLIDLATLFPDAYLGKSANFSLFPTIAYNVIDSNTLRINSFTSKSEQYNVQFSFFDDNADCLDLMDLQKDAEGILLGAIKSGNTRFVEVHKVSTIGPRYITHEKIYQIIDIYQITICENKIPDKFWYFTTGEKISALSYPLVSFSTPVDGWSVYDSSASPGLVELRYASGGLTYKSVAVGKKIENVTMRSGTNYLYIEVKEEIL